eukprot:6281374-Alexandrium_andersonii.AAC.1
MSASLVGSEMCIRDSLSSWPATSRRTSLVRAVTARRTWRFGSSNGCWRCLLYTSDAADDM